MAFKYGDRVQETFSTTGTGTISLAGAATGYQTFSSVLSNGDTCYYAATDGTNWEVGLGTYASGGNTLARTTVLNSSNSGAAVNWLSGVKNIWLDLPAAALPTASGVTGSGQMVLATSPTLVTPALGTPASGNLSNCTNVPMGLVTALGVNSIIYAQQSSGSTISAGGTTAAANLSVLNNSTSGTFSSTGDSISGTWQALQSLVTGRCGLFQRTV